MSRIRLLTAGVVVAALSACLPLPIPWPGSERPTPTSSSPTSPSASAPTSASSEPRPPHDGELPTPEQVYTEMQSPDRPEVAVPDARPPGFVDPPPGAGLSRYFDQPLTWTDCAPHKCATFIAPLDWHDPDGQAITIAMKMAPATAPQRLGAIFINPGGPGGSSQDYVAGFATAGLEGYDIIGMDSRGSGESTPVVCGTGKQTDDYYNADGTPDDQAERDALVAAQQQFNDECRAGSGPLLDHISTIEAIYDYDLARHLIGDQKLNFYGISCNCARVRSTRSCTQRRTSDMVLDSAVNLTPTPT